MTYRAKPVTQRDGSSLANSNCRCGSIASGLDYDSLGSIAAPTASKVRSYMDDQAGGTDSGDARQSWDRGWNRSLRVMDGHTWADALADLRAGRLVHIDVWHASVGGPCLSGSGAYGHTMAVAPEYQDGKWLVSDPWCSPAKWAWTAESKLKAGAEYWGNQVYSRALQEPDYPSGGPGPRDPRVLAIVARIVRRLMTENDPGNPASEPPGPDTGGGGAILYTTTAAHESEVDTMVKFTPGADVAGTLTVIRDTAGIPIEGGDRPPIAAGIMRPALGLFTLDDLDDRPCYLMGVGDQLCFVAVADVSFVPDDGPNDGGDGDGGGDLAARQAQWDADADALVDVLGPRPA